MSALKVAAIILAAGGSTRLGRPKQLLDWFGKPFVKQLIDLTHEAELDPIVVVTGAGAVAIENVIQDENVVLARNDHWQDGQSGSMQVGVKALEDKSLDAFIVFLCDQPHVPLALIKRMLSEANQENVDIIATSVNGKVCPPTLFRIKCKDGINSLTGDQGGRALFKSYETNISEWKDERLLQDSDTEEDYLKLIALYSK